MKGFTYSSFSGTRYCRVTLVRPATCRTLAAAAGAVSLTKVLCETYHLLGRARLTQSGSIRVGSPPRNGIAQVAAATGAGVTLGDSALVATPRSLPVDQLKPGP